MAPDGSPNSAKWTLKGQGFIGCFRRPSLRNDRIQREGGGAWREGREGIIEVRGSRPRKGGAPPLATETSGRAQGTHGLLEVVPTVYRREERERKEK